jgi:hypothetical protein
VAGLKPFGPVAGRAMGPEFAPFPPPMPFAAGRPAAAAAGLAGA